MPVTDLGASDEDWINQFLAGHMAGQTFGSSQPYAPGGATGPYSGGSQGLMPGGGVMGRQGATSGAPSMGYPAMGHAPAQGPPAAAPAPGMSLSSNPLTNWLRNNVSIGAPNLANAVNPDFWHDLAVTKQKLGGMQLPQPTNSAWLGDTGGYMPSLGGDASPPAGPTTANPAPRRPVTPTPATAYPQAMPSRPVTSTPATAYPSHIPIGGGAGNVMEAPTGSPSQTPRPASSDRFIQIDRVNAGPLAQPGRGYQTALNLANLFRRG